VTGERSRDNLLRTESAWHLACSPTCLDVYAKAVEALLRLVVARPQAILGACTKSFGGYLERRRAVRFQLRAPAILEWTESSGARRENVGRTRDISILGTFVICPTPPPTDTAVNIEVHLPPLERNTCQQLRLRGSGKVTRTAGLGQESGFATHTPFVLEETGLD